MYNPSKIVKNQQMPVVLIAGGAGFLGSHLAEYLLGKNFRVVVVDNLETGHKEFLGHLLSHPRFGFVEYNLNLGLPDNIVSADAVFHLLGEEIYIYGDLEPSYNLLLTNSLATYHLLEFTKNCGAKFLLASSLNIYQGIASGTSLANYFGASPTDERIFSYNESKRYAEGLTWEYFKKYSLDVRVARLPEVYGPRMSFASSGTLGRLLQNVVDGKNLEVFGDGLDNNYYLYVSDAVEALYNCLTKTKTAGRIFSLASNPPISQLEQAYLLKNMAPPGTEITFRPKIEKTYATDVKSIEQNNLKLIDFREKIHIREGLKTTLDFLGFSPHNVPTAAKSRVGSENKSRIPEGLFNQSRGRPNQALERVKKSLRLLTQRKRRSVFYVFLAVIIFFAPFVLVPTFSLAFHLGQSFLKFNDLKKSLTKFDLTQSVSASQELTQNLTKARLDLTRLILPNDLKKPWAKALSAGTSLSASANHIIISLQSQLPYLSSVYPETGKTSSATDSPMAYPYLVAADSLSLVNQALDELSLAEAELKDESLNPGPPLLIPHLNRMNEQIKKARKLEQLLKGLVSMGPDLLGFDRPKSYLVLLQNSNELRPTGGFIGALIKIGLDGGKMTPPEIEDIYNLDGKLDQLGQVIAAPKIFNDTLETTRLHIRDANYDISFPQSSLKIKKLYKMATGENIDGVVAIDLEMVKNLLTATGPIFLSTYNEEVGAENLFEKVQFHAEAGFAEGTSGKKTFLSLLSQKLLEKFLPPAKESYLSLLTVISQALEEKHLLLQFYFESAQGLSGLDLDGDIKNTEGDFLMVVDTNLGANKANYYVKRSLSYEAERSNRQGEIASTLTVSYDHTGNSDAWPGGPYKNFLRILVPNKGSLIKAERVDVGSPGTDTTEDITSRVLVDEEGNKTSFGFLFDLKSGQKTQIVLRYVLPPGVFSLKSSTYELLVQRQPGPSGDPIRAKFILPFGADVEESLSQGFTRQGNAVIYEGVLKRDLVIKIPLSSK